MKKNKKVFLMGGIGNQLFQLARALELYNNNYQVKLIHLGGLGNIFNYFLNYSAPHENWISINAIINKKISIRTIKFIDVICNVMYCNLNEYDYNL